MLRWPAGLDPAGFLHQHWQKTPLFLRGGLPGFRSPLDPDELAGLACDPQIESRLVLEHGDPPWQLEHGPFDPERLARLDETGWSLLVQDIEKHVPATGVLGESFRFLPDWRLDDLMASFAPPGGSVGPHVDAYDVFLVQGLGRRRWLVDATPGSRRRMPGTALDLLADFRPDREWIAEPGDVLYLPPGAAHHGIALEPCITWSVGFRSPTAGDLLAALADAEAVRDARYADPDLVAGEVADGLISDRAIARFRRLLEDSATHLPGLLEDTVGRLLTEPKSWLQPPVPEAPPREPELRAHLAGGGTLARHPMALVARTPGDRGWILFANGQAYPAAPALEPVVRGVCQGSTWPASTVAGWLDLPGGTGLILDLLAEGVLEFV